MLATEEVWGGVIVEDLESRGIASPRVMASIASGLGRLGNAGGGIANESVLDMDGCALSRGCCAEAVPGTRACG